MPAKYFLDTNIFVYCFDRQDRRKQKRAEELVAKSLEGQSGVISTQVVQEFLNVASTKFARPMKAHESRAYLDTVLSPLCGIFPTITLFREALTLAAETRYSFYDSLIIAAAIQADCTLLYSEDFQNGQTIREITIVNPFVERTRK